MILKVPKYKTFLFLFDLLILFISYILTYKIIFTIYDDIGKKYLFIYFIIFLFIIPIIFIFNFQANNLYKINVFLTRAKQLVQIIKSYFYSLLFLVAVIIILGLFLGLYNKYFIIAFVLLSFINTSIVRLYILKPLYQKLKNLKVFNRNVIIIGAGKSAKLLATKLFVEDQIGIEIIGFADDKIKKGTRILENKEVLGSINEVARLNGKLKFDEVIISIDNIDYNRLLEIIDLYNSNGTLVKVNSELFKTIPENLFVEKYSDISVVNTSPQVSSKYSLYFKKIFDKLLAFGGIILLLPFFIVIVLIIKLTSKGPAIFKQKRIGLHGKPFNFYKFRSMYISTNGNEDDPERIKMMLAFMKKSQSKQNGEKKIINEKRVTPIGKFLRKYSLDELPQLFNVLKGDMSLVGPRPCLPYEYENYDDWQKKRLQVLPGCTGVWQVYGRSKVNFDDSIIMDIYYINNMSPWLDLQLIIKTIPVLIFGKGGK